MARYYPLESCFDGHKITTRHVPYTESGFDCRHKARRAAPGAMIIRGDRVAEFRRRYVESNN